MHEQEHRPAESARPGGPARHASGAEHPLLLLQRTAGNAAVSSLVASISVQRQPPPGIPGLEPLPGLPGLPGAGSAGPEILPAGVVNVTGSMVNVMGGVVSVAGGPSPGEGSGGGGRPEEIPVPTTGGV